MAKKRPTKSGSRAARRTANQAAVDAAPAGYADLLAGAVLNLCETADPYQTEIHAWEPIADAEPAPGLDWLRQRVEFIDAQRRAGRVVYLHCRSCRLHRQ